ncbi:hypothetical protein [Azospirillum picis]|uniref:RsiW-degrading membrane proteinase PrsW (M82 family) n=1 Tax=Azospirillum picis TaxID=488438 RepID=A0ABU0MUY8_9PROT|nr:hypothetical protein [Azospirillum picis]MBP2303436.1 RsiW-degrading membrane proteinase PrsW (M82 family) [Azospirillum picis]MDQ0537305.1 RsiW-degrading membrane proteinase PrsW (M82 family) [Azospirillum picis]
MAKKPTIESGIGFTEVENLLQGIGRDVDSLLQAGAATDDVMTIREA